MGDDNFFQPLHFHAGRRHRLVVGAVIFRKGTLKLETPEQSPVEGSREWYRKAFDRCEIDPGWERSVASDANLVLSFKDRYERVSGILGLPWFVIGCIHFKEASCNFSGCLHNGQRIIGTRRKTTIVPIGRGPFSTWEESAVDAIRMHPIGKVHDWELGNLLFHVERYNGSGYLTGAGRQETSPYLWARTTINDGRGKYVSDGKFDPNASTQSTSGVCAILKMLEKNEQIEIIREIAS